MKRCPELRFLSSEHHAGLVIALRAKKAAQGLGSRSADEVWAEILTRFPAELEPHFRSEEEYLLPALARAGEAALVERTLAEHAAMRQLLAAPGVPVAEALLRFGALLENHIRFEERELFEAAERQLSPAELKRIAGTRLGTAGQACRR